MKLADHTCTSNSVRRGCPYTATPTPAILRPYPINFPPVLLNVFLLSLFLLKVYTYYTQSLVPVGDAESICAALTQRLPISPFDGLTRQTYQRRRRGCLVQKDISGGDLVPQRVLARPAHGLANSQSGEYIPAGGKQKKVAALKVQNGVRACDPAYNAMGCSILLESHLETEMCNAQAGHMCMKPALFTTKPMADSAHHSVTPGLAVQATG